MFNISFITFLLSIGLILCISYFIGKERAKSGKDIGFRSISLVMIGAYVFTYISTSNFEVIDYHVIAQVVTGISFVGAGLIFKRPTDTSEGNIYNLTTAILVWSMASVGILIGIYRPIEAIVISLVIYIILHSKKNKNEN